MVPIFLFSTKIIPPKNIYIPNCYENTVNVNEI